MTAAERCNVEWCTTDHSRADDDPFDPWRSRCHYGDSLEFVAPHVDRDDSAFSDDPVHSYLMRWDDSKSTPELRLFVEGQTSLDAVGLRAYSSWLAEMADQVERLTHGAVPSLAPPPTLHP
jgi:hypothetical protein